MRFHFLVPRGRMGRDASARIALRVKTQQVNDGPWRLTASARHVLMDMMYETEADLGTQARDGRAAPRPSHRLVYAG